MTAYVHTAALTGFEATPVTIEVDTSRNLPTIVIVGMANKSIDEAKERIRSAITNSGLEVPKRKITINMAPADLPKSGAGFDLAMALAVLLKSRQIPEKSLRETLVIGELGLDGSIRPVRGIIAHVASARKLGFKKVILPPDNLAQARLVDEMEFISASNLKRLYRHLCGLEKLKDKPVQIPETKLKSDIDFSEVVGQDQAKRALEIAAAGSHNLLMNGPPGGGKTMLAKATVSIMPELSSDEVITITQLHSLVSKNKGILARQRPFRSPHHSASNIALVGGGTVPLPGEISLAHGGILFLDEIAEFPRSVLESLRQPLEDGNVTISRAQNKVTYPAQFMLIATQNPCPCGYSGDEKRQCVCTSTQILAYRKRLSGPLLDRIDIQVRVDRTDHDKLLATAGAEPSSRIAERVASARKLQLNRQGTQNAHLSSKRLKNGLEIDSEAKELLESASERLGLSSRGFMKTLKVARTIADLEASPQIKSSHIAEALQYRAAKTASMAN